MCPPCSRIVFYIVVAKKTGASGALIKKFRSWNVSPLNGMRPSPGIPHHPGIAHLRLDGHAFRRGPVLFAVIVPHAIGLFLAPAKEDIALRVVAAGLHVFRAALHFRVWHATV
jgi:hypothetical protein